jgi:hypothetical protein
MFAYCGNNPIRYEDSFGGRYEEAEDSDEDYELVGIGVQFEASGSLGIGSIGFSAGIGFEVIVYWGTQECKDHGEPIVAVYVYNAGSGYLDTDALRKQILEIADLLLNCVDLLKIDGVNAVQAILNNAKLNFSASFSASVISVWGNSKFYGVDSYLERFDNLSVTAGSIKYGYAWSDSCKTHSLGYNYTVGKPLFYLALPTASRGASYYGLFWDSRLR